MRLLAGLLVGVCLVRVSADLVLVGGGLADDNSDVYGKFVELAGGVGVAKIGVITTASANPLESAIFYEALFTELYGAASATWIPVTENSGNADTQEIYDLVAAQTGLFLGGGDQARIMTGWRKADGTASLGMQALLEAAESGVVGGTSAGAACQGSGPMIEGGLSYQALRYGAYPGGYNPDYPDDLCYDERGGLGTLKDYIVDTHYSERGREGRLIELVLDTMTGDASTQKALGIDENTGVHVDRYGNAKVLGAAGGAMVVDLREATHVEGTYTRLQGVRVSFFTEGDAFNLYNDSYTIASWKSNLAGQEYYDTAPTSSNIFSSPDANPREDGVFREVATSLWDSKEDSCVSDTYERNPEFVVTLSKSDGAGFGGFSHDTTTWTVSYARMAVDIDYQ